jgi:hypothetical protein
VPDLTRIKAAIGFAPKLSLDQIIRSVIEHERSAAVIGRPAGD